MAYSDVRTEGEHDCDRILYSSAFRRLAGVTQVVSAHETQLFHNRLTHTLKVAQLSRRLARALTLNDDFKSVIEAGHGPDEAVAEASALGHDVGHPPFGHIGEAELNQFCRGAGLDGFDGNAQSFRILTKLARRNSEEPGLDLSPRTLRGILKYPYLREGDHSEEDKWGVFSSERSQFETALQGTEPGVRSVEAEIMDWADDISYATHDLEDFYRAGLIPLERVTSDPVTREEFIAKASAALRDNSRFDPAKGSAAFRELTPLMVPDSPYAATHGHRRALHRMTSELITRAMKAASVHASPPYLRQDPDILHEVMLLKQLTWQFVVNSSELASLQEGHVRMLRKLTEGLDEWMVREYENRTPYRLPTRLHELYIFVSERDHEGRNEIESHLEAAGKSDTEAALRARAIADYISSLTEEQAMQLYERLFGVSRASVLETWVRA